MINFLVNSMKIISFSFFVVGNLLLPFMGYIILEVEKNALRITRADHKFLFAHTVAFILLGGLGMKIFGYIFF